MNKSDYTQNTNTYITEYIKFGDAKAGSILVFLTALVGAMVSLLLKLIPLAVGHGKCVIVVLGVGLIVYAYYLFKTVLHSLNALNPRVDNAGQSLNSFPDIASFSRDTEYVDTVEGLSESELTKHYSRHNWALSRIALNKFQQISKSIINLKKSLYFSLLFSAAYLILQSMGA